jgi:hypothetical protein
MENVADLLSPPAARVAYPASSLGPVLELKVRSNTTRATVHGPWAQGLVVVCTSRAMAKCWRCCRSGSGRPTMARGPARIYFPK